MIFEQVPESLVMEGEPLDFKVRLRTDREVTLFSIDIYDHGLHLHPQRHWGYWIFTAEFAGEEAVELDVTLDPYSERSERPVRLFQRDVELQPSSSWHNPDFLVSPVLDVMVVASRDDEELERVNIPCYVQDPQLLKKYYSAEEHKDVYEETAYDLFLDQFHKARVRVLASVFKLYFRDIDNVVDVGSGTSMFRHISDEWPYEITCCDLDEPALRKIGEESPHFKRVISDATDLPFPDGEFDALYAGEIMEHVIDPGGAVREWKRVVRPGGLMIVTTPNAGRLLNRVNREREVVNPEHINEMTYREIWKLLENEDLRILDCRGIYLEFLFNYFRRGKKVDLLPRRFGHQRYKPLYRLAMGMGNLARPFAFDLIFVTRKEEESDAAA